MAARVLSWTESGMVFPLLTTVVLRRISRVALLQRDISERRPVYADYVRRTNAFFPGRLYTQGAGGASA